jgi:hypothetical protein
LPIWLAAKAIKCQRRLSNGAYPKTNAALDGEIRQFFRELAFALQRFSHWADTDTGNLVGGIPLFPMFSSRSIFGGLLAGLSRFYMKL